MLQTYEGEKFNKKMKINQNTRQGRMLQTYEGEKFNKKMKINQNTPLFGINLCPWTEKR